MKDQQINDIEINGVICLNQLSNAAWKCWREQVKRIILIILIMEHAIVKFLQNLMLPPLNLTPRFKTNYCPVDSVSLSQCQLTLPV